MFITRADCGYLDTLLKPFYTPFKPACSRGCPRLEEEGKQVRRGAGCHAVAFTHVNFMCVSFKACDKSQMLIK